ncbi:hypothetical protein VPH35_014245 [Triticum aestivum]
MPKRTMGGRADAMAHEASKPRAKLHKEKLVPAGEGSSRQQGGLDVVDHVQALHPVQVAPTLEQVTPLPRHLPPLPQPIVNVDGDDDGEEVLSDDVDSDPETQRIYKRQKVRELDSGALEKRIRPRIGRGLRMPLLQQADEMQPAECHLASTRNLSRQHQ